MSKAVTKLKDVQVTSVGRELLEDLRSQWKQVEIEREVTGIVPETNKPGFVKKKFLIDSPIKQLNQGVPAEVVYNFVNLVEQPDDIERIKLLISSGSFEVLKAIQAFDVAPKVAMDRKIVPTGWNEAKKLNSPSLATLIKYKGEDKAEDLLYIMLLRFSVKFGKRNDMTEESLKELAGDICVQFKNYTVADIKMILYKAVSSSKKVFNLDYQRIMSLLHKSFEKKLKHFEDENQYKHLKFSHEEKAPRSREGKNISSDGLTIKDQMKKVEHLYRDYTPSKD